WRRGNRVRLKPGRACARSWRRSSAPDMARMTVEEFEEVVLQALERLPEQFRDALHNLDIEVRWRPSLRERRRAGLHERGSLFGTYTGIPLTHRGQSYN